MEIRFDGRAKDFVPLFEPLPKLLVGSRIIDPTRNTSVNNVVDVLLEELASPNTRADAQRRFKELPIKYFLAAAPDKAALVAERLYKRKLITPEELFEDLVLRIVNEYPTIKKLETRLSLGQPGRLTLGGTINPGIKLESLKNQDSFAVSIVRESLQSATRQGEPNLQILFPQFLQK